MLSVRIASITFHLARISYILEEFAFLHELADDLLHHRAFVQTDKNETNEKNAACK